VPTKVAVSLLCAGSHCLIVFFTTFHDPVYITHQLHSLPLVSFSHLFGSSCHYISPRRVSFLCSTMAASIKRTLETVSPLGLNKHSLSLIATHPHHPSCSLASFSVNLAHMPDPCISTLSHMGSQISFLLISCHTTTWSIEVHQMEISQIE
jgi:hypothetical protein